MPLHLPPAPESALRCVSAALGAGAPGCVPRPAAPQGSDDRPVLGRPLAVHRWEPESSGGGSPHAGLTGWRFSVTRGDRVVAAAHCAPAERGWAFSHCSAGPYLASTERALRQAESLPADFQGRLLSVPGLYMLCLWLHGDPVAGDDARPGPADPLIPLAPAPPGVAAHRLYRAGDLLPLLAVRLTPREELEPAV